MIWSEPMDATLTAAWHASVPTTQIAALVGFGVSASAVRGRARDLHLPPRGELEAYWSGRFRGGRTRHAPSGPLPDLRKLGPDSKPVGFSVRAWNECAFPVGDGDGDMLVCGGPVRLGGRRPYCPFHYDLTLEASDAA